MKITRSQLKQLIKEEVQHINEDSGLDPKKFENDFRAMITQINAVFDQGFSGEFGNLTINFPDENFVNAGPQSKEQILNDVNEIKAGGNAFGAKVMILGILSGGLHMGSEQ